MNKQQLVDLIAQKTGSTKVAAEAHLDAVFDSISHALKQNEPVQIHGFGKFSLGRRAARTARNPKTGAQIEVPARVVPKFSPYKALKELVDV
ncbi:MAG: HU family DNA-binding protein [Cyanophyceae cyanobacterium]